MQFSKWHGLGNDYLLVERAELAFPLTPERGAEDLRLPLRRRLRRDRRGHSRRTATAAEVVIWNPDGSTAELSGNGTRIAARWLARRSGARRGAGSASARARSSRRCATGKQVETEMGPVEVGEREPLDVDGEQSSSCRSRSATRTQSSARRARAATSCCGSGPLVENHERFPERTNVQFVRVDGPHDVTRRRSGNAERGRPSRPGRARSPSRQRPCATAGARARSTVHLAGGDLARRARRGLHTPAWSARPRRSARSSCPRSSSCEVREAARRGPAVPLRRARAEGLVEAERAGIDVISLGIGDPDLPTPPRGDRGAGAKPRATRARTSTRRTTAPRSSGRRRRASTATASASSSIRTAR